jgi:hypothetical protein
MERGGERQPALAYIGIGSLRHRRSLALSIGSAAITVGPEHAATLALRQDDNVLSSVDTSKPATSGRLKTGHQRWRPRLVGNYFAATS